MNEAHRAVEEVARTSYGRLVAYLASVTGDLAAAEDALGDALVAALRTWPVRGVPDRPDAWLVTAARRTVVDAVRHDRVAARALPDLALLLDEQAGATTSGSGIPDKRLELLFACTHPAIAEAVRAPLMLQAVLGLDAVRIGSAFLVAPSTMGQRLVRAKAKIKKAGVPFTVPAREVLADRVTSVLDAVYAAYGTGWDDAGAHGDGDGGGGGAGGARGLVDEAVRLARLTVQLLPGEPEAHGLLALLLHSDARSAARRTWQGAFVPLDEQDVALWSRPLMASAEHHLALALAGRRVGPYQLMAAVQSVHNRRALTGTTDRAAVAALHDGLVALAPTIGALVARAAARSYTDGPRAALVLLDELPPDRVASYQPYWAVRAHCLAAAGDPDGAAHAAATAAGLTQDPAVRAHLRERLGR